LSETGSSGFASEAGPHQEGCAQLVGQRGGGGLLELCGVACACLQQDAAHRWQRAGNLLVVRNMSVNILCVTSFAAASRCFEKFECRT